jgi:hypothetical protein
MFSLPVYEDLLEHPALEVSYFPLAWFWDQHNYLHRALTVLPFVLEDLNFL